MVLNSGLALQTLEVSYDQELMLIALRIRVGSYFPKCDQLHVVT